MHAVSDGVGVCLKENVKWRSNISFKMDTEQIALLQVKYLIQVILKFRT